MYWRPCFKAATVLLAAISMPSLICAQQQPSPESIRQILERLDSLEKQNDAIIKEIHDLRQTLAAQAQSSPPLEERVEETEQRTRDQAQTKVGASQRFPISLTGMFLFDATKANYSGNEPTQGSYGQSYGATTGATLRQSIIGLDFYGPHIFGDGQIKGSLSMDFYAGSQNNYLRIRRGVVSFDWRRRSITFGQDKVLIAPLQPTSFAHVGIPALSGTGNLWFWLPQARYEERIPLGNGTELKAQAALIQTNEMYSVTSPALQIAIEPTRPAGEFRMEVQHSWSEQPRLVFGVGGHISTSHIAGRSIASRVVSADFKFQPKTWLQFSGTFLHGENFANLGGLGPGFGARQYYGAYYYVVPVRSSAGWVQIALPLTTRLTVDFYAGRQLNTARDVNTGDPYRSLAYAGNVLYRIAPNVVVGFEGGQTRLTSLNGVPFTAERYDATVAYLF